MLIGTFDTKAENAALRSRIYELTPRADQNTI